jgi:hypothetical protein
MIRIAVLCTALAAVPAFANDLVARQGADVIRLATTACTSEEVLSRVAPQMRSQFRTAQATVDGRTYTACWRMTPSAAHLVYEDGDQGLVPLSALKPQLSA